MFTPEVQDQLKHYVYRLIDPRTGETFYVGKGTGNRVFEHAEGVPKGDDITTEKLLKVREIIGAGFSVTHVIHRHGMDEKTALEVEAALMDAFPATTNIVRGHHSAERGIMHANEIIEKYQAEEATFEHKMVFFNIDKSYKEKGIYDAVRFAWKVNLEKVNSAEYVLAVINRVIRGVFEPEIWLEATEINFPEFIVSESDHGRYGFIGCEASTKVKELYLGKRMPEQFKPQGAKYINF